METIKDLDRDIYQKQYPNFMLIAFNHPLHPDEYHVGLMSKDGKDVTIGERKSLEYVKGLFKAFDNIQ